MAGSMTSSALMSESGLFRFLSDFGDVLWSGEHVPYTRRSSTYPSRGSLQSIPGGCPNIAAPRPQLGHRYVIREVHPNDRRSRTRPRGMIITRATGCECRGPFEIRESALTREISREQGRSGTFGRGFKPRSSAKCCIFGGVLRPQLFFHTKN